MTNCFSQIKMSLPISTLPHVEEVKKHLYDLDTGRNESWNTSDALAAIIYTGQEQIENLSTLTTLYDIDSNRAKHDGETRVNKALNISIDDRRYINALKERLNRIKTQNTKAVTAEDIITYFFDEFYMFVDL